MESNPIPPWYSEHKHPVAPKFELCLSDLYVHRPSSSPPLVLPRSSSSMRLCPSSSLPALPCPLLFLVSAASALHLRCHRRRLCPSSSSPSLLPPHFVFPVTGAAAPLLFLASTTSALHLPYHRRCPRPSSPPLAPPRSPLPHRRHLFPSSSSPLELPCHLASAAPPLPIIRWLSCQLQLPLPSLGAKKASGEKKIGVNPSLGTTDDANT